jgi:hypothetical protein
MASPRLEWDREQSGVAVGLEFAHQPWSALLLNPRKLKTNQMLGGGEFAIQEKNTRMLHCPGPDAFPTLSSPCSYYPLIPWSKAMGKY